jgi:hypothetical protein
MKRSNLIARAALLAAPFARIVPGTAAASSAPCSALSSGPDEPGFGASVSGSIAD